MNDWQDELVKFLENYMQENNVSYSDLATLTSVPVTTLRMMINKVRKPTLANLIKISYALNVSLDEMLGLLPSDAPKLEVVKLPLAQVRQNILDFLHALMKKLGLNQYQLARTMGLSDDGIRHFLRDKKIGN